MSTAAVSFAFAVALVAYAGIHAKTLWRQAPDRAVADTLEGTIGPVVLLGMGGAAVFAMVLHRDGLPLFFTAVAVCGLLGISAKAVRYLDRRAGRRRRRELGLAQPRRFIPPWVVGLAWAVFVIGVVPFLLVPPTALVVAAVSGDHSFLDPTTNNCHLLVLLSFAAYGSAGLLVGRRQVQRQRRKIAAERDRIAQLDRDIIDGNGGEPAADAP